MFINCAACGLPPCAAVESPRSALAKLWTAFAPPAPAAPVPGLVYGYSVEVAVSAPLPPVPGAADGAGVVGAVVVPGGGVPWSGAEPTPPGAPESPASVSANCGAAVPVSGVARSAPNASGRVWSATPIGVVIPAGLKGSLVAPGTPAGISGSVGATGGAAPMPAEGSRPVVSKPPVPRSTPSPAITCLLDSDPPAPARRSSAERPARAIAVTPRAARRTAALCPCTCSAAALPAPAG